MGVLGIPFTCLEKQALGLAGGRWQNICVELIEPMGVVLTYSPLTSSLDTTIITIITTGYIKWTQGTTGGGQASSARGKRWEEILPLPLTSCV